MNDLNFCSRGNDFEAYTKKGVFFWNKNNNKYHVNFLLYTYSDGVYLKKKLFTPKSN